MSLEPSYTEEREVQGGSEDNNVPPESSGEFNTNDDDNDSEYIGDDAMFKDDYVIRIGLINIRGIPEKNENAKNEHTKAMFNAARFDHVGMTEINRQWKYVNPDHQWHNRIKSWWQHKKSVTSWNKKDINKETFQPGGTISLCKDDLTSRIYRSGADDLLGRWTWVSYRGSNGMISTVVTGYRPCRNMAGCNTNYIQHKRVLTALEIPTCPRKQWLEDIADFIKQRQQQQEQIIVMADFNEDVQSNQMKNWSRDLGLRELIIDKLQVSPPTTNKGSNTIDGIFSSPTINAVKAGYCEFGLFRSDHRALWIDVKESNFLGFKPPDVVPVAARRLQCGIPSVKKKWKQLYTQKLRENNLFNKQFQLEAEIHHNGGLMTENLANRCESIMETRFQCMAYAEKNCRKLKMGRLPFSPETSKAQTTIELIQAVITKKKGLKYSSRKLRRLEKKAGKFKTMNMSLYQAEEALEQARKHFWECIKNAKFLRQSFLERRAEELAQEKETKQEAELKQLIT